MIYGSVCSGIEAASVAWHPLGWRAAFLSEIEPFPRAVLQHHYRDVPLHGDFTTIQAGDYEPIDLLVGGTPCQSFSVAGLRGGLADERGNLALEFLRLAERLRPRWLVWENVPGVLSSGGGRDFGSFLGGLVQLGYGFSYRVLDAQFYGLAQRRKRVFVVGHLGDWRRAWAVLSQPASLRWDSPPRREAGERAARCLANVSGSVGGQRYDGESEDFVVAPPITSNPYGDHESREGLLVAHALRAEGFDASEDGTGRGTPLVPVQPYTLAICGRGESHDLEYRQDGTANALLTPNGGRAGIGVGAVAIPLQEISKRTGVSTDDPRAGMGIGQGGDPMFTLQAGAQHGVAVAFDLAQITSATNRTRAEPGLPASTLNGSGDMHVAWSIMPQNSGRDYKARQVDVAQPVMAGGPVGGNQGGDYIQSAAAVRRLTPRECERLQGFRDDYTRIPYGKKGPGSGWSADGPRYRALGNSMAVPCMAWIGRRIAAQDAILAAEAQRKQEAA